MCTKYSLPEGRCQLSSLLKKDKKEKKGKGREKTEKKRAEKGKTCVV